MGKPSWLKEPTFKWASIGAFLSLGAPIGLWFLLKIWPSEPENVLPIVYWYSGVATCIAFSTFGYMAGRLIKEIKNFSVHDGLTGLFNRQYFMEQLEELLVYTERYPQPLSVLMLDLDYFKQVNDRFGHDTGDQTLKAVAAVINKECRKTDIPARYGGEEFIIACPNTGKDEGYQLAERIRKAVKALSPRELGFRGTQTISIGVMSTRPGKLIESPFLMKEADNALYQAKHEGRNKIVSR